MQTFHSNSLLINTPVKTIKFDGRDHLVAPVILLTEGVHNGSSGPLFYSANELQKIAHLWNGVPIPVLHPTDQYGQPISCNSPDIIQSQVVGNLWNVLWDEFEKKLRGEIYVDITKANKVSPVVLEYLTTGKPLEVSTGLFSIDEPANGEWDNENYEAVATNIQPDHLALLPGGTGACSWADGCGVRINSERGDNMEGDGKIKQFVGRLLSMISNVGVSLDAKREAVCKAVKEANKNNDTYIVEVFDDHIVFEVYHLTPMAEMTHPSPKLYTIDYTIDKDNNITFTGDPEEVKREINYVPVTNEEGDNDLVDNVAYADPKNKKYPIDTEEHVRAALSYWGMEKNRAFYPEAEQKKMAARMCAAAKKMGIDAKSCTDSNNNACSDKEEEIKKKMKSTSNQKLNTNTGGKEMKVTVCDLITNQKTRFTEADREWLSTLSEDQLATMVPMEVTANTEKPVTFESLLASAPSDVKARFAFVDNMIKTNRDGLIARIKSNATAKFTDEQLGSMSNELLAVTADSVAPVANYAAGAGANTVMNASSEEEALTLPDYETKK
jgi:hypothetical protein